MSKILKFRNLKNEKIKFEIFKKDNYLFCKFIIIFIFSFKIFANSQDLSQLKKANELYKLEKYENAIEVYNEIIKSNNNNPELFYNLGNCYFRLDEIGKSILYYEKALKLNPSDEDIKFNLKIANLKTIDKFNTKEQLEIVTFYENFISIFHSNTWLYFSVFMLITLLFSIYSLIFNKNSIKQKIYFVLGSVSFMLFLTFTIFSYSTYKIYSNTKLAILTVTNSYIKSSPEVNGKNLIMIHEGLKLEILEVNENWNKVKLPDGNVGWVEKGAISNI